MHLKTHFNVIRHFSKRLYYIQLKKFSDNVVMHFKTHFNVIRHFSKRLYYIQLNKAPFKQTSRTHNLL